MSKQIPIENLYYLLCYAWDRLKEGDLVQVAPEECATLQDLFAKVLIGGVKRLRKRGFNRDYLEHEEEMSTLRGRIAFSPSIREQTWQKGRMVCEFTELDYNTIPNRILKTTLRNLLFTTGVSKENRNGIAAALRTLHDVRPVILNRRIFRRIQYHQNLRFYRFLMNVCELVYESLIPNQNHGDSLFRDFERDEAKMARLFEAFVRNFYRRETTFAVNARQFPWAEFEGPEESRSLLPTMNTDVELQAGNELMILDCKYYVGAFTENHGTQRFRTNNLYQLYAYVMNKSLHHPDLSVSGMLLYPEVTHSFRHDFILQGHRMTIASVNLNQPCTGIARELKKLIGVTGN